MFSKNKIIRKIIIQSLSQMQVPLKRMILFGSRARGNFLKNSDYDLLIIIDKTLNIHEKMKVSRILRSDLSEFAVDIFIKSEQEINEQKNNIGSIVRNALKEGIVL